MNEELEKRLFGIEPRFFEGRDDLQQSLMGFGFACGDGWFNIVRSCILEARSRGAVWDRELSDVYEHTDYEPVFDNEQVYGRMPKSSDVGELVNDWYDNETRTHPNPYHPDYFEILQVKEKFGTLRFYYRGGLKPYNRYIESMQNFSRHVCERCGSDGTCRPSLGWIQTLCDDCFEKVKEKS